MIADDSRHRLGLLAVCALSLFGALFARLWFLQVVEAEGFEAQVTSNSTRTVITPAPRGRILDRNGVALVDNRESIVVAISAQDFRDLDDDIQAETLQRLATELSRWVTPDKAVTVDFLEKRLNDSRFSAFRPVPVAEDIKVEQEIYFREQADRFPSVVVERRTVRKYPYGSLAAHVLGYVGSITQDEYDDRLEAESAKPYEKSDEIGKSGVERTYEEYLRGIPGKRVYEINRNGRVVRELTDQRVEPESGDDVFLSIDARVQAQAEISLREGLEQRAEQPGELGMYPAEAGAAAVVDPSNGQVVALASYPTYDPSTLVGGIECSVWRYLHGLPSAGACDKMNEEIEAIPAAERPLSRLLDRSIAGLYPPGSTFKLATAYAGLELGLIDPNTTINDPGYFQIPGCTGERCRVSSPSAESGGIGSVNLSTSLTASSDTYYYKLGNDSWALHKQNASVGPTALQDEIAKFGIGAKTGIDLVGEKAGRLPDPEWLKEFDEQLNGEPTSAGVWQSGASINLAIGQGDVLVTPIQMANAFAAFANGGTLYQPTVISKITAFNDPEEIRLQPEPVVLSTLEFDPASYQAMMDGFEGVTQSRPHATAASAFAGFPQATWPVAGKTGTAQNGGSRSGPIENRKEDHSWFVGFGPTDRSRYSASVIMENSGSGGAAAAPAVRRVLETIALDALDSVDLTSVREPDGVLPSDGVSD